MRRTLNAAWQWGASIAIIFVPFVIALIPGLGLAYFHAPAFLWGVITPLLPLTWIMCLQDRYLSQTKFMRRVNGITEWEPFATKNPAQRTLSSTARTKKNPRR